MRVQIYFFSTLLLSLSFLAPAPSTAFVSQSDLLIRTKSSDEIIKLHFSSPAEAQSRSVKLSRDRRIESIAPDFIYRPAIHYRVRESHSNFIPTPFAPLEGSLPEVLAPPALTPGTDPLAEKDWALKNIHMPTTQELASLFATESKPAGNVPAVVTVAVIDTGIDYNHEDLAPSLWHDPENPQEVGYDFAHGSNKPYDVVHFDIEGCLKDSACSIGIGQDKFLTNPGHGTHCAGHVAAVTGNSLGIRGVGGGMSRVMGLKIFTDSRDENPGIGDDAAAIKSIDYAIAHGAKVISASWGGRETRAEGETSLLKQALIRAQKAGVIVVVSAGNEGIDQDKVEDPNFPAAYDLDNLIVVAASDLLNEPADFTSYGVKSVHIAAPGVKILSTVAGGTYSDVVARFHDKQGKDQQLDWDGTSMATPIVAGAVALVWAKFPQADYHEIRARILNTARKYPGLADRVVTGGVLDVSAALGL